MNLEEIPLDSLLKFCQYLGIENCNDILHQKGKRALIETLLHQIQFLHDNHLIKGGAVKKTTTTTKTSSSTKPKKGFTRTQYRQFLRWAFTGLKVAVGTVATVFSFGGGADTITDLFFTLADFGILSASVVQIGRYGGAFKKWVQRIYSLPWTGNPEDVRKNMEHVFEEIDADKNHAQIYEELCALYMGVLDNIAALFGSLVSTIIPDDLGATRVIIQLIISQGKSYAGKKPFDALVYFYNKIPQKGREAIKSKESITNLLNAMVSYLLDMLPSDTDTMWTRTKKHLKRSALQHLLLPLVPGGILVMPIASTLNVAVENKAIAQNVSKWTKQMVEPNIPKFADLMMHVLPMAFAVTLMFSRCSLQGTEITQTDIEKEKQKMK